MRPYPYRTDEVQAALEHLQHSPYAFDDMPFLNTQRYSMSGYEPHHIQSKALVDAQGTADNLWWLRKWEEKPWSVEAWKESIRPEA